MSKGSSNALRASLARPLILCIEDEPIHLTLRKKVLERDGYDVIGATTADEARKIFSEAPVCAVITKWRRPATCSSPLPASITVLAT